MWPTILGAPRGGNSSYISGPLDPFLGTCYLYSDANYLTDIFQDSTATTPVASNTDPVGYWADRTGNGRHWLQTTSAARPQYRISQDGTPGIKMDEVDDFLLYNVAMTTNYEVYIVAHWVRTGFPGPGSNVDPLIASGTAGGLSFELRSYNGFGTTSSQRAQVVNGGNSNGNLWLDGRAIANNTNVSPSNRTHIISSNVGSPTSNVGHYLGKMSDNSHYSLDAIKAVMIYTSTHTSAQRLALHQWAIHKGGYGLG